LSRASHPPRTAQGAASRERLLQAAIELIAERGYAATSVEAVCRHADTVKTALYWHFGNKEGLLTAALDRVAGDWIEEITRGLSATSDPAERLERAIDGLRKIVEERPELMRLLVAVAYERTGVSPEQRAALAAIFERAETAIVTAIADAIGGEIPGLERAAHLIIGLLVAASLRRAIDPEVELGPIFEDMRYTVAVFLTRRLRVNVAPDASSS
jgi:AcrR family transcriptional regulator